MRLHSDFACRACCLIALTALITGPISAQVTYRAAALSGAAAPGTPAGVTFSDFNVPMIDSLGRVCFMATLSGPGITTGNDVGIWVERGGALTLLAREGSPAPDVAGASFSTLDLTFDLFPVSLGVDGTVAFNGTASGSIDGIWSNASGVARLVAREGQAAPGVSGNFGLPTEAVVDTAGRTSFIAPVGAFQPTARGIWSQTASGLQLMVRDQTQAPGTPAGVSFFSFSDLSASGTIGPAFRAELTGASVTASNDTGLWAARPVNGINQIAMIAREGNPAPGTGAGVVFGDFPFPPYVNSSGLAAFWGRLVGSGVTSSTSEGIWSQTPGVLSLLARRGTPTPIPGTFFGALGQPAIGASGHVVFSAAIGTSPTDISPSECVWIHHAGQLLPLLRENNTAPGTNARFGSFDGSFAINSFGQVAFFADLGAVAFNVSRGIWATDTERNVVFIARWGTPLDINPDPNVSDLRTVTGLGMRVVGNGTDGHGCALNDAGQVAFVSIFSGGVRGVIVASIPRPCPPDLNLDGELNADDLADYINCYFAILPCPAADVNRDSEVNADDLGDYINAYFTGC